MPAYYAKRVREFLQDSESSILGELTRGNSKANFCRLEKAQTDAWSTEIGTLKTCLSELSTGSPSVGNWGILLEYPIPRRQKRIDAVLLVDSTIVVIEFKCGLSQSVTEASVQVEDYALDLADFHEPSHKRTIIPIAVAHDAKVAPLGVAAAGVQPVLTAPPSALARLLEDIRRDAPARLGEPINADGWNHGRYTPVPTVIEAALAIFAGMEVREIAHTHADAKNLTATVDEILKIVRQAQQELFKAVCFVTGVPGSGKTLAGLRAVHDPSLKGFGGSDPAFMSGNGPLVRVLREALARDLRRREDCTKKHASRSVLTLIQNVHEFARENYERDESQPPHERIIVFDEAQRAWNAEKNKRKFERPLSEPSMILQVIDRHKDWAVLVALIGGGQEIHDGEAGLAEWGKALASEFRHWKVFASPEALSGGESVAGSRLFIEENAKPPTHAIPHLHLPISTRSYKAEAITVWSNALLEGRLSDAAEAAKSKGDFPVYLTRDLEAAKCWLRKQTRGSARCGLVASSDAVRLRAYGIETSTSFHQDYPYELWFLNGREDVRSSYRLEVAATEFEIQGLELDYVGLCWGGDLIWNSEKAQWEERNFRGTSWLQVKKASKALYLRNKYRVLLTRARQGTVIWVPPGILADKTVHPSDYDPVAYALSLSGAKLLPDPRRLQPPLTP